MELALEKEDRGYMIFIETHHTEPPLSYMNKKIKFLGKYGSYYVYFWDTMQ